MVSRGRFRHDQQGFTYLVVLVLLALSALLLTRTGEQWSMSVAREKEQALIAAGQEIQRAIKAYYDNAPGTLKHYPPNLESLLEDRRYLTMKRYLRKIPRDPITGTADWGVVMAPTGGVMGVYSQSQQKPLRQVFTAEEGLPIGAQHYSEWQFVYRAGP